MSTVKKLVDIRVSSARKQIDNVLDFIKTPKGLFETVDTAVKTFRQANREMVETIGLRVPLKTQRKLFRR
jgi:hypothetical protein